MENDRNSRRPVLLALKGTALTIICDYGDEYDTEEIECIIDDVGEKKVFLYDGYPSRDKKVGAHVRGWILLEYIVAVNVEVF